MNEELNMEHPNEPDVYSGEGNGHTRRVPEWGDVEFVPSRPRPRRSRLWEAVMTSKPVRNIAEYAQAERRPVPTWVPSAIVTILVLLISNFGIFMYWKGRTDAALEQLKEERALVKAVHDENIAIKQQQSTTARDLDKLEARVETLRVYEHDTREKLISGKFRLRDLPTPPE